MKKAWWVLIFTLFLWNAIVWGQNSPLTASKPEGSQKGEVLPAAEQIIEKYINFTGGKTAIESIQSELQIGSFENAQGSLPVEIAVKNPNKWRFELKLPDGNSFKQVCNGSKGWRMDPQQGWVEMTRDNMLVTSRMLDLHGPLHFKETFSKLVIKGAAKVGERKAYLLEATPKEGSPQTMYFDAENGQLMKIDFTVETPEGTFSASVFFENYKDVNGAKVPFTIKQSGNEEWTMNITEIKRNPVLDDKQFEKPE
jgi:zinc protease